MTPTCSITKGPDTGDGGFWLNINAKGLPPGKMVLVQAQPAGFTDYVLGNTMFVGEDGTMLDNSLAGAEPGHYKIKITPYKGSKALCSAEADL